MISQDRIFENWRRNGDSRWNVKYLLAGSVLLGVLILITAAASLVKKHEFKGVVISPAPMHLKYHSLINMVTLLALQRKKEKWFWFILDILIVRIIVH